MKIFKKTVTLISTTLAMLTFASALGASASYPSSTYYRVSEPSGYNDSYCTCNSQDTFWAAGGGPYARHKKDYSSVYVNNTSDGGTNMDMWGLKSGDNTKYHIGQRYQGGTHQYSDEDIYIPNDGPHILYQFARERNMLYVVVRFTGSGSGYWSPDTSGSGYGNPIN